MERIISKIDHDMNILLNNNPEEAEVFWKKINQREHILKQSTKVVNTRNGRMVFSPAVCHMILTHPYDVNEQLYHELTSNIIKDKYLSRISVANDLTFLSLIVIYGLELIDNRNITILENSIRQKAVSNPFITKNVVYDEIKCNEPKTTKFRDNLIEILLSHNEVHTFSKREHMNINETENFKEIDILMNYSVENDDLDIRIKNAIYKLYSASFDYRTDFVDEYEIDVPTPKL